MSTAEKDIEILALRHQLAILQRQIDKPQLTPPDRAFLAALLHKVPRPTLRQLHLIVCPDTVLRWHRDFLRRRHARASRPKQPGRRPTPPQHPSPRPAPGTREPRLGLSENPRRTRHTCHQGCTLHCLGDPQDPRHPARTPPGPPHLGHLPAQPGARHPCRRLLRNQHPERNAPVRPRRCRTCHPAYPHPRRDRTPHRSLDYPDGKKSDHGSAGRRYHGEVPDPGPGQQIHRRLRCRSG
jgi:hypothetical protein